MDADKLAYIAAVKSQLRLLEKERTKVQDTLVTLRSIIWAERALILIMLVFYIWQIDSFIDAANDPAYPFTYFLWLLFALAMNTYFVVSTFLSIERPIHRAQMADKLISETIAKHQAILRDCQN